MEDAGKVPTVAEFGFDMTTGEYFFMIKSESSLIAHEFTSCFFKSLMSGRIMLLQI